MAWSKKIPDDHERPCSRPGCGGTFRQYEGGLTHFDADGAAMVDLRCDKNCGMETAYSWTWKW